MTIENLIQNESYTEKFVLQKLICYFLDYTKEEMRLHVAQDLENEKEKKILAAYDAIVQEHKPLEYVLGFVEFFGNKFHVNGNTLIPRPETEYMITAVTEHIDQLRMRGNDEKICNLIDNKIGKKDSPYVLMDIGTGCGVLGTSVLLQNTGFFSKAIFTDVSPKALEVAQQNYEILIKDHDFPVEFIQSDLLEFLELDVKKTKGSEIVIVANLPYIPEKTFEENAADNVKKREPKMAFVGGDDGLDYYKKMFDQLISLHFSASDSFILFLEMMTRQVDILRQLYKDHFVFEEVKTFHFNIRIVKVSLKNTPPYSQT